MALITHPDLPDNPVVTVPDSTVKFWTERKGWKLVEPAPATKTTAPAAKARPDEVTT